MTPQEGVQAVINTLRDTADRISRGEQVSVIFAADKGGPHGVGNVFLFAPPQVAADLTIRLLGATLNLGHSTQTEVLSGALIVPPKSAN